MSRKLFARGLFLGFAAAVSANAITLDQTAGERSAANAGARADSAELGCRRVSNRTCHEVRREGQQRSFASSGLPAEKTPPPLSTDQAPQTLATPTSEPAPGIINRSDNASRVIPAGRSINAKAVC
jgi:hypothetical protein